MGLPVGAQASTTPSVAGSRIATQLQLRGDSFLGCRGTAKIGYIISYLQKHRGPGFPRPRFGSFESGITVRSLAGVGCAVCAP